MTLPSHRLMALLTLALLLVWLPSDLPAIAEALSYHPRLALGLSLKILMHLVAVIGLWRDRTAGYAFLLGASLQGLLVAAGGLRVYPLARWPEHLSLVWWPALDAALRVLSLGYLITRPGRMVGKGAA